MDISFSGSIKNIEKHFQQIEQAITPTAGLASEIGNSQIEAIRERSARGVDARGVAYAPYSSSYAKWKRKHGGTGIVNLFGVGETEHMLLALEVSANGRQPASHSDDPLVGGQFGIGIYGNPTLELRLRVHNEGRGKMPKREVLGMNQQEIDARTIEAGQYIDSKLKRLL